MGMPRVMCHDGCIGIVLRLIQISRSFARRNVFQLALLYQHRFLRVYNICICAPSGYYSTDLGGLWQRIFTRCFCC